MAGGSATHPLATEKAPACAGPLPEMTRPSWPIPADACDTHAHVIGDGVRFPFVDSRSYTAPAASEAEYLSMLDGLGVDRGVLVQVSIHGTDNRLMVESLRRHPKRLRGVAVCPADVSDAELRSLQDSGVRGLRINVTIGGGVGFDAMDKLAQRIAPMGWHLQFLIDPPRLIEAAPRLKTLPVPVVIDHIAGIPHAQGVAHPAFAVLLDLLKTGTTWVKLSGAYRQTADLEGYSDTLAMPQALIAASPDTMVWGSDWPHVHFSKPMIRTGGTLEVLGKWAPDAAMRRRILVDNPARLYRF